MFFLVEVAERLQRYIHINHLAPGIDEHKRTTYEWAKVNALEVAKNKLEKLKIEL